MQTKYETDRRTCESYDLPINIYDNPIIQRLTGSSIEEIRDSNFRRLRYTPKEEEAYQMALQIADLQTTQIATVRGLVQDQATKFVEPHKIDDFEEIAFSSLLVPIPDYIRPERLMNFVRSRGKESIDYFSYIIDVMRDIQKGEYVELDDNKDLDDIVILSYFGYGRDKKPEINPSYPIKETKEGGFDREAEEQAINQARETKRGLLTKLRGLVQGKGEKNEDKSNIDK